MAVRDFAIGALLLTSTVLATPTPPHSRRAPQPEKKGFRVEAHRHIPKVKRDTGAVYANFDGGGWIIPVLIGGQQMTLNIDTGSSDIWTASTLMPSDQQSTVTSGAIFDLTQSSTFSYMNGSTYGIAYADGSGSSGPVGIDTINIGGASVTMPFGVCDSLKYGGDGTGTRDTDGPVGLGFGQENSIRPNPQCTFMECLEPYVPAPIFSTGFKKDATGFIDFGYVDTERYSGDVTDLQIDNSTGRWFANDVQFGSGGTLFDLDAIQMDFDTGTSTLSLPEAVMDAYFALVPSATQDENGSWYVDCGADLPDFDYVFSHVNSGPTTVSIPGANLKNSDATSGSCYTYMGATTGGGNAGVPFYISKYMMFNQANPSLAVADQA